MYDLAIIGAGPAGIGLLSSIYRLSIASSTKPPKLCIIDAAPMGGEGVLDRYNIPSDTQADKILTCLEGLPERITSDSEIQKLAKIVRAYGSKAVPLPIAGQFIRAIGQQIAKDMISKNQLKLYSHTKALSATRCKGHMNGYWKIVTQSQNVSTDIYCKHLVMACGASEVANKFDGFLQTYNLRKADLKSFCLSSDFYKTTAKSTIIKKLKRLGSPKVVIIGGSHSAISVAVKLLSHNISFGNSDITIFHRSPMRVTFDSAESALRRGFTDFSDDDICQLTKRVFALKGFRLDSRDLLMSIQGHHGGPLEKRISLSLLKNTSSDMVKHALQNADLTISALGYAPNYLPLFRDNSGSEIELNTPDFVNERSQLLDHEGNIIPNCHALGLASNYKLAGRFGELSFKGQANGLVLWHKEIGQEISMDITLSLNHMFIPRSVRA